ncbi:peptidylprolyl isomerase [Clostridium lundense]|uniref:peptidylprolyl isomerase n=1 Tax=Clostridium lundense TaxID=319475 RepID=UPI0004858F18|nr:peptidylprolyl isomerase [Clostridium lundense]
MKNIRKLIITSIIGMFAISTVGCTMIEKTPEAINKSTVAQVNNEKITRGELDSYPMLVGQLQQMKQQYGENYASNPEAKEQLLQIKKQVLDQMVTENLVLQQAKNKKLVDDKKVNEEVEKAINNVIKTNFNNDKNKYQEELKKSGVSEENLKNYYKTQLIITKVRDELVKSVKIDDTAAKKQYDSSIYTYLEKPSKFHAYHILVKTEDEAKKVKERLNKGEDFAKVAKEVSTDPGSKDKGGDLGAVEYGQFVKPFVDAVVKLNKGEVSEPVKSDYGYHIIKVIDKEPFKIKSFDSVKEQIKKDLLPQEQQKVFNDKIEQWKKEAKIETKKYEKNLI